MQTVNTKPQTGGKTKKRKCMNAKGRGQYLKGWSEQQPGYHERTVMMKECGNKCFLGPKRTFPICTRNTCKINRKGVYAAYIRARQYKSIKDNQKYSRISAKARKLLYTKLCIKS
jgi:hypothetical protein